MSKLTNLPIAIFVLATGLVASAKAEDDTSSTLGDARCRIVLEQEQKHPTAIAQYVSMFAGGVVTGFNIEMRIRDQHFIDVRSYDVDDTSVIWKAIRPYCVAHPDSWLSTASLELLKSGKTYKIVD